jgi:hypothetical protein
MHGFLDGVLLDQINKSVLAPRGCLQEKKAKLKNEELRRSPEHDIARISVYINDLQAAQC